MEKALIESALNISVEWLPPFHGPAEVEHTSAALEIRAGRDVATRFEDAWSKSVQQAVRVPLYPLGMWLAQSWWRIRWEPFPSRMRLAEDSTTPDADWRMSHELAAAGGGYIWPRLTLWSDGEAIHMMCRPSPAMSVEPVKYLSDFDSSVPSAEFEAEIDSFIDLILRRLDLLGTTDLHILWDEVLRERVEPRISAVRRLEARLGFDPDEGNARALEQLQRLASKAGEDAVDEIAAACAGSNPEQQFEQVLAFAKQQGVQGAFVLPMQPGARDAQLPPWQRGKQLARAVRESSGSGNSAFDDRDLAAMLSVHADVFRGADGPSSSSPVGLAIRTGESSELKLLLRKRNRPARRFEAARVIADYLSNSQDRWHPATDSVTARQKMQRAFAAEFLCPIDALGDFLGDEFDSEAIEGAAEHFGISELAIKSHLANNHLISRGLLEDSGA